MKNKSIIVALLLIIIIMSSCQKTITIPQPAYDGKISIQSLIEPDSLPSVYVYHTVPFFDSKIYNAQLVVREAFVTIKGGGKTDTLRLDSIYNKLICDYSFWFAGKIPILNNTTYTLTILYNNEIYTASATTDLIAAVIDSVGYVQKFNDLYGEHEGVITYFKDVPSQTNFYRYEMFRPINDSIKHGGTSLSLTCIGHDTLNVLEYGRSVYNDVNLEGQQIKIIIEPGYSHYEGIEAQVLIATIDRNAFSFFDQLDKQKLGVYNPFVEPVFLVDGQFGSKAVGFFGSMKTSDPVDFTFPE